MSMGGKSTQTQQTSQNAATQPNIPPEMQSLLDARTGMQRERLPGIGALIGNTLAPGTTGAGPAYSTSVMAPYQQAMTRATDSMRRNAPGANVMQATAPIAAAGSAQASALRQQVVEQFLRMLMAQEYPLGEQRARTGTTETETRKNPGLIDYLTTVSNIVSAARSNASMGAGGK